MIKNFDGLHDVLIELDRKSRTLVELIEIFNSLPEDIQMLAHMWSCSDTEFRDKAYVFLQKKFSSNLAE